MNNLVNLFFLLSAKYLILYSLILSSFLPVLAAQDSVLIYIRDDVFTDYQEFVAGRDVTAINKFSGKKIRRDVVDMIIAQQALKLGGFKYKFTYAPGKVNFRNTQMLQNGELLLSFDSYWKKDATPLSESIYISDEVIRNGEYVAGIYTSPKNKKTLAVKKLADLRKLTAVSTPKWRTDWQTLQELSLKDIVAQDSWLSMVRMVNLQWIDFILMPFNSTPDKSFTMDKIHLVPVEGIAIALRDSRHFVISKLHPKGAETFQAINKGLRILREKGIISRAYEQAGFFIDHSKINIIN
jgi:hypothetical protein